MDMHEREEPRSNVKHADSRYRRCVKKFLDRVEKQIIEEHGDKDPYNDSRIIGALQAHISGLMLMIEIYTPEAYELAEKYLDERPL